MCRVYVGTYAKYSSGSIAGAWLDLTDYTDLEEFLVACAELHSDESEPEFMFQDFEGFPRSFYSECSINPEIFEYAALDEFERERVDAYAEYNGEHYGFRIDYAIDNVIKLADFGESDYMVAYAWCEEMGVFEDMPEHLRGYLDVESYFRDCGPSIVRTSAGVFGILD